MECLSLFQILRQVAGTPAFLPPLVGVPNRHVVNLSSEARGGGSSFEGGGGNQHFKRIDFFFKVVKAFPALIDI